MEQNRAQSTATTHCLKPSQPLPWLPAASGLLALTAGLQGAAANAVGNITVTPLGVNNLTDQSEDSADAVPEEAAPAAPVMSSVRPRFSGARAPQPVESRLVAMARLESHQRELHQRSNEVESRLLAVQELLSLQAYGTSFADRLLEDDTAYQAKLQQLRLIEAEIHTALGRSDTAAVDQLETRLQRTDRKLRLLAQNQLRHHIEQSQTSSTLGLWREPMYRQSLRWLIDRTHERHLLKARQQTLARTMIAIASD